MHEVIAEDTSSILQAVVLRVQESLTLWSVSINLKAVFIGASDTIDPPAASSSQEEERLFPEATLMLPVLQV